MLKVSVPIGGRTEPPPLGVGGSLADLIHLSSFGQNLKHLRKIRIYLIFLKKNSAAGAKNTLFRTLKARENGNFAVSGRLRRACFPVLLLVWTSTISKLLNRQVIGNCATQLSRTNFSLWRALKNFKLLPQNHTFQNCYLTVQFRKVESDAFASWYRALDFRNICDSEPDRFSR